MLTCEGVHEVRGVLPGCRLVRQAAGSHSQGLGEGSYGGAGQRADGLGLLRERAHEGAPGVQVRQVAADGGLLRQHRQQPRRHNPVQIHLPSKPAQLSRHICSSS